MTESKPKLAASTSPLRGTPTPMATAGGAQAGQMQIRMARAKAALFGSVLAALLSGCYRDTQRFPGMLTPLSNPLPEGVKNTFLRGPEDAYVIRHSDPVSVRAAESTSTIKLKHYNKRLRAVAGSWVNSGPNGHVEVLLPGNTSITMRGPSAGVIGSESRREPAFTFIDISRASVTFGELGIVQLPGGALLEAYGGPFVFELLNENLLRVRNRSSQKGAIAYREELISLQPSEVVDLALLAAGTAPFEVDESARDVLTEAGRIEIRGAVDVDPSGFGARMRAGEGSEISGFGQILRLDPGDEVLFEGLGSDAERKARSESDRQ